MGDCPNVLHPLWIRRGWKMMKLEEFCAAAGVDPEVWKKIEVGEAPLPEDPVVLERIADCLALRGDNKVDLLRALASGKSVSTEEDAEEYRIRHSYPHFVSKLRNAVARMEDRARKARRQREALEREGKQDAETLARIRWLTEVEAESKSAAEHAQKHFMEFVAQTQKRLEELKPDWMKRGGTTQET